MIAAEHFAAKSILVKSAALREHWADLRAEVASKGQKLQQAKEHFDYDQSLNELEAWMETTESVLAQKDLGTVHALCVRPTTQYCDRTWWRCSCC